MTNIVELPKPNRTNLSALEMAQELVEHIKAGEVVALAIVAVHADRAVSTGYTIGDLGTYHPLHSGAARIAHQLAEED